MRIHFVDGGNIRETHDVDLNLSPGGFLTSLDQAIVDLKTHGHLTWFYRRAGVTFPHETSDEEVLETDEVGDLRQSMEIAVWSRPTPPHLVARERLGRMRRALGRHRYKPY